MSDIEKHAERLREERSDKCAAALARVVMETGVPACVVAHGEVCFHFDDGTSLQVTFHAGAQPIAHEESPNT